MKRNALSGLAVGAALLASNFTVAPAWAQARTQPATWYYCLVSVQDGTSVSVVMATTNIFSSQENLENRSASFSDSDPEILRKLIAASTVSIESYRYNPRCHSFGSKESAETNLKNQTTNIPRNLFYRGEYWYPQIPKAEIASPYRRPAPRTPAVPPKPSPQPPSKNYGITVRQPEAPAKPAAVKPASKPAPKPAAQPKLPPKLSPCGGKGQRPCKVKAE